MRHTSITDAVATVVVAVLFAVLFCFCLGWFENVAEGCDEVCQTAIAVRRLQPAASEDRAAELAGVFVAAGRETNVEPLLLLAIAMRESSLHPAVEARTRRGSRGEVGLMQVHPSGPAIRLRPADCDEDLDGARCQVRTGARFLAFVRDHCPGSTWRWVAAYGRSRCPSETEARADRNAAIAAGYYSRAGGVRW
jgi:hypothetical protein